MSPEIIAAAVIGGVLTGGVYALIAFGLTLIHGVLHIVNLAHGSLLMVAMFAAWGLAATLGIDPFASLTLMTLLMFAAGWALYAGLIGRLSRGRRTPMLLATLGPAAVLDIAALAAFGSGARSIVTPYGSTVIAAGPVPIAVAKLASFGVAVLIGAVLWGFMTRTDTGRSIRAVAREPEAARLVGIRPARMFALTYGVGTACLGAAACLLLPSVALSPQSSPRYLLIAVTAALLGGLGSGTGAILGGLAVGIVESVGGAVFGAPYGPVGVGLVFLLMLLRRPIRGGLLPADPRGRRHA